MKAYTPFVDVLGVRGRLGSRAQQDLEDFYAAPTLGPEALQILRRREIKYVMLPVNSPLNVQLEHLPAFTPMNNPGERYRMYKVDREILNKTVEKPTPVVVANGDFNNEKWDAAIENYMKVSEGNPEYWFLAHLGLGQAYAEKRLYAKAVESYEAALKLDPEPPPIHDLLASSYDAAGDKNQARTEFERAIELDSKNVDLRLRYAQFLMPVDQREAVEQHQTVVQMYPKVPDYRVKLGVVLLLVGDSKAADEEFEKAVRLSPLSAKLRADIGGANLMTGHPEKGLGYYEEALKLDPNSQLYALNLGKSHAQLSTLSGRDEGHFEQAEALFRRVEELSHLPWEADQREAARIALGDLYLAWDQPEDATAAYERALELNSDSEEAKKKLDSLRREEE